MPLRFANRTVQAGTYHTGSPAYVDMSAGAAAAGMVTFSAKAIDDDWADGDRVPVSVVVDADNYWVGVANWDATNSYLQLTTEEESAGTLSDSDAVTVTATITTGAITSAIAQPPTAAFVADGATARTLSAQDAGAVICFTSASAVAVTIPDDLPAGFHCSLMREGAGTVTCSISGTDTINGSTNGVQIAAQYGAAYLYQRTEGAWVMVAGA